MQKNKQTKTKKRDEKICFAFGGNSMSDSPYMKLLLTPPMALLQSNLRITHVKEHMTFIQEKTVPALVNYYYTILCRTTVMFVASVVRRRTQMSG